MLKPLLAFDLASQAVAANSFVNDVTAFWRCGPDVIVWSGETLLRIRQLRARTRQKEQPENHAQPIAKFDQKVFELHLAPDKRFAASKSATAFNEMMGSTFSSIAMRVFPFSTTARSGGITDECVESRPAIAFPTL